MRFVIQRVSSASVKVEEFVVAEIETGLLILIGIEETDTTEDINWLVKKTCQLRIFNDSEGVMNLDVQEIGGKMIVVSQFTLHASTKKGNRPSYIRAARPETAIPLYEQLVDEFKKVLGQKKVGTGIFGAHMEVSLVNDGPVTIILDSKARDF
ncbi:MAG TPA: D-tyrosyl-tRNA(Tyr) deacylase [Prolixibacteraceae bacterium]|nr:D-tyrosyl-tRNA(Tyr) deacylase [Prolixibacteraceae bacterium]